VTEGEGLGQVGEGKGERNVILWADHRAEEEAGLINKSGQGVLGFVGGVMSVSTRWFVYVFIAGRSPGLAQRDCKGYVGN
jgi:ribulose kinase